MPKDKLRSFILNYCDTAYGTPPAGCLNAFDARGLTKAEIDYRCGMAGMNREQSSLHLSSYAAKVG
jgi:hypothetical protein